MSCFSCFDSMKDKKLNVNHQQESRHQHHYLKPILASASDLAVQIPVQTFTFHELAAATKNFMAESILGEGDFGRVYKGCLKTTCQVFRLVADKQLDRIGLQGTREILEKGFALAQDTEHLAMQLCFSDLPPDKEPLDWNTRMKIAVGTAKGLEYLHIKPSNILLDEGYHPKLSDFDLEKQGRVGGKAHNFADVLGTYGYFAPDYAMTGQLTVKSDVYSFRVVFLELITGRKAIENTRLDREQNLVPWARPLFSDRKKFPKSIDPQLWRVFTKL